MENGNALIQGNSHKTIIKRDLVIQYLNPDIKVPRRSQVNKLVDLFRSNGIVGAKILYQNKRMRMMEKLEGQFYRPFTHEQCLKAAKFLHKLHGVLRQAEPIGNFHIVKEFGEGNTIIWGDVNASNFLWRGDKVVGIVDYDCVMKGDLWLDLAMMIVNWQKDKNFTYKNSIEILKAYGVNVKEFNWLEKVQKYILLTHKQYGDVSFGLDPIKKSRQYCKSRILKLNKQYEKSLIWRRI